MEKKKRKNEVDEIKQVSKKKVSKKKISGSISSGSDLIDLVIGGGYPYGLVNIVGDSGSGKSFLSGEIIANAFHKYGKDVLWFYDNAEKGYKFNSKKLYGIDILSDGFFSQDSVSETIEDFEKNIHTIIEQKGKVTPFIYVLDSFDGISSEKELQFREKNISKRMKDSDSDDKGSYNLTKQKETHALFRTLIRKLEENNILLVIISQVKEKINVMFGAKYYRTGGKSLDFYPNIIFWLAEVEKYKKKNRPIGVCVKVRGTKTRNDRPFRDCLVDLIFDYGIDNVSSNINFLYDLKTDLGRDKKKLDIVWDDIDFSRDSLTKYIEDNNLEEELKRRTIEKWELIEQSISSDERKRRF